MPLLVLVIVATALGCAVATLSLRRSRRATRSTPPAVGPTAEVTTGLALTAALVVIVGGGVLLGVLAYLVRGDTELVRLDASVASWADRHASSFSTGGLDAVTHLGSPGVVVVLAAVLAIVETARTRSRWVVPFLLVVVAGNGILTTSVKHLVDRVRPALNPVAETLGPSFPSGHSSWSAAFFAAAALLLSRGRPRRTRALIAGVAAALAVAVAGSRVLLSVHWLSDVIAGVALGSAWFAVCAVAFGGRLLRFGVAAEKAAPVAQDRRAPRHSGGTSAAAASSRES
jgi:membrane-associated phospholipid phosphatase